MLEELLAITSDEFFEQEGTVRIVSADWFANDLRLEVSVIPSEESPAQLWEIELGAVREECIASSFEEHFSVVDHHPVLLPFKEHNLKVFFNGKAKNYAELIGYLVEAHYSVVGDWLPLSRFINDLGLIKIVKEDFGLLAQAPEPLATAYRDALLKTGILVNITDRFPPKRWDGEAWIDETTALKALIIGKSYAVFETISAARS